MSNKDNKNQNFIDSAADQWVRLILANIFYNANKDKPGNEKEKINQHE